MTRTTGSLATGVALVIVGGVLLAVALPRPPFGIALTGLAVLAVGLLLLLAGVVTAASTSALLVVGAGLQGVGVVIFAWAQPRPEPVVLLLAAISGAVGFWLLLTGVVAAGVKIGIREAAASRDGRETRP